MDNESGKFRKVMFCIHLIFLVLTFIMIVLMLINRKAWGSVDIFIFLAGMGLMYFHSLGINRFKKRR